MRALAIFIVFLAGAPHAVADSYAVANFESDYSTVRQMIEQRNQALKSLESGPGAVPASITSVSQTEPPEPPPPIVPPAGRDPFATTPQMHNGNDKTGGNTSGGTVALNKLRLRGILFGKHQSALIDTGVGIHSLQVGDSFDVLDALQRSAYVVRAIHSNSVEIGTSTKTLVTLR